MPHGRRVPPGDTRFSAAEAPGSALVVMSRRALTAAPLRSLFSQNIMARGTDASGVGWLLRGFYQDHARQMDSDELAELETILRCSSDALASYILRTPPLAPPAHIGGLPAWRLLVQYHRFWGGAGHEPGGEYV